MNDAEETKLITPSVHLEEIDLSNYSIFQDDDFVTVDRDSSDKEIINNHTLGETILIFNKSPEIIEILIDENVNLIAPVRPSKFESNFLVNMTLLSKETQELIKNELFYNKLKRND